MGAVLVETHTALVLAAGDRVYKAKKRVSLPFVDLSTPELRRLACSREVELNSRLSPDVYLGVATLAGVAGEPEEPVVVMRRLPAERRLAFLVTTRSPDVRDEVVKVARRVAAFHASLPVSTTAAAAASPASVQRTTITNLDELARTALEILDPADVQIARDLTATYIAGRHELFRHRMPAARDGHGDLLADDIFCLADGPRILDCLEFDASLRECDVLADVTFLAMDLERLAAPDLARVFLDTYSELAGASWPESLEHFYIAQRALIRAKVACIRDHEGDPDARAQAALLLRLALRHLRSAQCRLVLVGGIPGSGKSTVARRLADVCGLALLRSDVVRKQLHGISRTQWRPEAYARGLYASEHTEATYAELLRQARLILGHGDSVVIDASWLDPAQRSRAAALVAEMGAELVQLRCVTPVDVAERRVIGRSLLGSDPSDATPEVTRRMAADAAPWPEAQSLMTTEPVEQVLTVAARAVGCTGVAG